MATTLRLGLLATRRCMGSGVLVRSHPHGSARTSFAQQLRAKPRRALSTADAAAVGGVPPSAPAAAAATGGAVAEAGATSRPVAMWLVGTAGAVAVMVTVGGITRLTRSGLSMTDWKLQGSMPPRTQAEWEAEFERYKQFPEYSQRRGMTVDDFKNIFWWEYGHRMLGRVIGVIYGVPLAVFAARGMLPKHIRGRAAGLLALGGAQGLIGWWMVKSGLKEETMAKLGDGEGAQIRVSPYRLATHLGMAFATFSLLIHTGLDALHGPGAARQALQAFNSKVLPVARSLRGATLGTAVLSFVTAMSGAFVAGNDAGRAYNTFPKMTYESWLPEDILDMQPLWRNFFENTGTVQATHRTLAFATLGAATGTWLLARRGGGGALWAALPKQARMAQAHVIAVAGAQVSLGLATLLLYVPIPLAAAHQAGALALLGSTVWGVHALRFAGARAAAIRAAAL